MTWATASLETPHGLVEVDWRKNSDVLTVNVTLPEGVSGVLDLAGQPLVDLSSGRHESRTSS